MRDVASFVDVHCCRLDAGVPRGIVGFNSDGAVGLKDCALVVGGVISAVVAEVLVVMGFLNFTFTHGVRERQVRNRPAVDANKGKGSQTPQGEMKLQRWSGLAFLKR